MLSESFLTDGRKHNQTELKRTVIEIQIDHVHLATGNCTAFDFHCQKDQSLTESGILKNCNTAGCIYAPHAKVTHRI